MNLFKQYSIKAKIKIIAFSAIVIIISMLLSLILLFNYFDKREERFQKNQHMIQKISQDFQSQLLKETQMKTSQNQINNYFNNLQTYSNRTKHLNSKNTTHSLLHTFILLLSILLVLFMFFGYHLNQTITKSLVSLRFGMSNFFNYIINNKEEIEKIEIIYEDEIGEILHYINNHINEVKEIMIHEREFNSQLTRNIDVKTELLMEKSNYLEQYKNMIDQAEAVIQFDMFGNIVDTNEHYCNLSQYSKEELIGEPIVNFINSKNPNSEFHDEITTVIKEGTIYKGINSDLSKSGETFTTQTVILPMLDKDGIIEYFFCIRTDITELKTLTDEIIATQKDVISTMGEIGESRSKETGLHVKRVAEYSRLLGRLSGLKEEECDLIYNASPMHDIGKIAIPDSILKKPAKLTTDEFEIMKTHARLGYDMLKNSKRDILSAAAIIAHEHHEKYNGTGYPNNKKGEDIHIFGRITAIADIFDALGSHRCYKNAWPLHEIIEFLTNEKGKHLDPKLVDLFIENIDDFLEIRDRLKDTPEEIVL
ncbi:HD domain-containing protein [Arcobacteraceae bacterium]|nr:HD domain-containing protein [Arcobacteraceae bacterium]